MMATILCVLAVVVSVVVLFFAGLWLMTFYFLRMERKRIAERMRK